MQREVSADRTRSGGRRDPRADTPVDIGWRQNPLWVAVMQLLGLVALVLRYPEWWLASLLLGVLIGISIVYGFTMAPYPRFRLTPEGLQRYRWSPTPEFLAWSDLQGTAELYGQSLYLTRRDGRVVRISTMLLFRDEALELRSAINRRLESARLESVRRARLAR